MTNSKRARDYGLRIGCLSPGPRNTFTDVPGVQVGHATIRSGCVQTGVTAIRPHSGNLFQEKVPAACHVINGFGKTAGTVQIEELGTLETPILLTNTLSVGTVSAALVRYMLEHNPEIGLSTGTVNPVVAECNDGYLNDIRGQHVTAAHVTEALAGCSPDFAEGAVGAGTGMSCYGLKGGIGSSSRLIDLEDAAYTVGVLVLANFGAPGDLTICGVRAGEIIRRLDNVSGEDRGSIIIVLATDLPASDRQLRRIAMRSAAGLAKTGSFFGNGSGDIALAFSTAQRILHDDQRPLLPLTVLNENYINAAFRAAAEATEEAVLNALLAASDTTGRDGNSRRSLAGYMDHLAPYIANATL